VLDEADDFIDVDKPHWGSRTRKFLL